jgi:hypothetical protein
LHSNEGVWVTNALSFFGYPKFVAMQKKETVDKAAWREAPRQDVVKKMDRKVIQSNGRIEKYVVNKYCKYETTAMEDIALDICDILLTNGNVSQVRDMSFCVQQHGCIL